MATTVLIADDFESYSVVGDLTTNWSVRGTPDLLDPGNIDGKSVQMSASNEDIYLTDPGVGDYYSILCRFRVSSIASSPYIMGGTDNSATPNRNAGAAWIRLFNDGAIQVVRGTGASTSIIASTAASTVAVDTTYELELRYYRNNSGHVELYLDGTEVIAQTAGDTLFNATLGVLSFSNTVTANVEFDDCVIRIDDTALPTPASTGYAVSDFAGGGGGESVTGVGGGTMHFGDGVVLGTGVSKGSGVGG